jgi:thymidylate kinase
MDWVIQAHQPVFDLLRPDLVLYLDLSIDESLRRIHANRAGTEHYEKRETLEKVRANYLEAFSRLGQHENIHQVDAARSLDEISSEIIHIVQTLGK